MASIILKTARSTRVALVLGACLLLGACSSTTSFFYNRLHIVLPWYLDRYVDLDREQSQRFDIQLEALLDWHRRDELPRYVLLLDDALARLDGPLLESDVLALSDAAEEAWYRLRDRGLDELLVLGTTLSDEQVEEFLSALDKRQRKYERKYLPRDDEKYHREATENLRDNLEDYLGRLDSAQRATVREAGAVLLRSDALWLAERQRWLDMLGEELRRLPGWQSRVRERVLGWEATLDAPTSAVYDHNTRVIQAAIAAVVDARSDKQDKRLRRKLSDLRDDLQRLHDEAEPADECLRQSQTVSC